MFNNEQISVKKFAAQLKSLRLARKLTLRELESQTEISNSFLSQIESGKRGIPGFRILEKLAKVYGPSIWDMFKGSEVNPTDRPNFQETDPDLQYIVQGYKRLSPEDKRMFKEWLEFRLKNNSQKEN